jgi:hypothetical protein
MPSMATSWRTRRERIEPHRPWRSTSASRTVRRPDVRPPEGGGVPEVERPHADELSMR